MILIALSDQAYGESLESELTEHGVVVSRIVDGDLLSYMQTFHQEFAVVVADACHPALDSKLWQEVLKGWAKKAALFLLSPDGHEQPGNWLKKDYDFPMIHVTMGAVDLANYIQKDYRVGPSWFRHSSCTSFFDRQVLANFVLNHKIVYLMYIDASAHQNIYTEYGVKVHAQMLDMFSKVVRKVWQEMGRSTEQDLIFRQDANSNVYYIFTPFHQEHGKVLPCGFLNDFSHKFFCQLQIQVREFLMTHGQQQNMVGLFEKMLSFSVGYASLMHNHCFNVQDQINIAVRQAKRNAGLLQSSATAKEKDFLQSLMASDDFFYSRFQGVFDLKNISEEDVHHAREQDSLSSMRDKLYGFESLLGIDVARIKEYVGDQEFHVDPRFLNPDTLFKLAQKCDVSLELDQVCIGLATENGLHLPGMLLVNIFPRNLYYIEKLAHLIPKGSQITFEIAESRIIKNFDFLLEAKSRLQRIDCRIATDDVCRGYANFQRLIAIKPDLVKLDRAIIVDVDKDPQKESIIKLFVDYSSRFNHKLLAEGVETIEELRVCKRLGVDYVQGFLLHKPERAEDLHRRFGFDTLAQTPSLPQRAPKSLGRDAAIMPKQTASLHTLFEKDAVKENKDSSSQVAVEDEGKDDKSASVEDLAC
ncbi:MAG: EAL domain-containing protein [Proteobacteria bacterium]|nr:EAL domain-containing protein [Pseudomonadota bacterium]